MQFQSAFDPRSVNPADVFMPIPAGDYKVIIESSEPKATSDGDGSGYLEFVLKVIEGQHAGRELKYRLNLWNKKSAQTVEIAYRQLSAICHAIGFFQPLTHSEQLYNNPFIAIVTVQSGGQYNDVKGVKDLAGNIPGKGGVAGVASAAPPAFAPPAAAPTGWGPPAIPAATAPAQPSFSGPPAATPAPWSQPAAAAPAARPPWEAAPTAPAAPVWKG